MREISHLVVFLVVHYHLVNGLSPCDDYTGVLDVVDSVQVQTHECRLLVSASRFFLRYCPETIALFSQKISENNCVQAIVAEQPADMTDCLPVTNHLTPSPSSSSSVMKSTMTTNVPDILSSYVDVSFTIDSPIPTTSLQEISSSQRVVIVSTSLMSQNQSSLPTSLSIDMEQTSLTSMNVTPSSTWSTVSTMAPSSVSPTPFQSTSMASSTTVVTSSEVTVPPTPFQSTSMASSTTDVTSSTTAVTSSEATVPPTPFQSSSMASSTTAVTSSEVTVPPTPFQSTSMASSTTAVTSSEVTVPSTPFQSTSMASSTTAVTSSEVTVPSTPSALRQRSDLTVCSWMNLWPIFESPNKLNLTFLNEADALLNCTTRKFIAVLLCDVTRTCGELVDSISDIFPTTCVKTTSDGAITDGPNDSDVAVAGSVSFIGGVLFTGLVVVVICLFKKGRLTCPSVRHREEDNPQIRLESTVSERPNYECTRHSTITDSIAMQPVVPDEPPLGSSAFVSYDLSTKRAVYTRSYAANKTRGMFSKKDRTQSVGAGLRQGGDSDTVFLQSIGQGEMIRGDALIPEEDELCAVSSDGGMINPLAVCNSSSDDEYNG